MAVSDRSFDQFTNEINYIKKPHESPILLRIDNNGELKGMPMIMLFICSLKGFYNVCKLFAFSCEVVFVCSSFGGKYRRG